MRAGTYLGGEELDRAKGLALGSDNCAYLIGDTQSTDFPTRSAYQPAYGGTGPGGGGDIFITKFSSSGSSIVYSTYLGGSRGDFSAGITVDSRDCVYLIGDTDSTDFPTENAYQDIPGGYQDLFIIKLASSGTGLIYSTYLGGARSEEGSEIKVDDNHCAYLTGSTVSDDFPTLNSYQPTRGESKDAFLSKLSSTGSSLIYSTYLGASEPDVAYGLDIDSESRAYLTGTTTSPDFPTKNPYQAALSGQTGTGDGDAFVVRFISSGSDLDYSTYLGGEVDWGEAGRGIAVDGESCAYVTGFTGSRSFPTVNSYQSTRSGGETKDAFLTKFSSSGSALMYSTYLGGINDENAYDEGCGSVAIDSAGRAYLTGYTKSEDFPTVNAFQVSYSGGGLAYGDAFVARFTSSGTGLIYSTYLGGSGGDNGFGLAVADNDFVYIAGLTNSDDFPTVNPYQSARAEDDDAFLAVLTVLTPSPTPTPTPSPTVSPSPSTTPSSSPTPTPSPSLTPTPTPEGFKTPTPSPTATSTPEGYKTPSPSPTSTPTPTKTPTPPPTPTPSPTPTVTPSPSLSPSPSPTPSCSRTPYCPGPIIDFNGDGSSDITVFRPTSGLWAIRGISRVYFGQSGDETVPGDYNGNRTTEIGIFRPSTGLWAIRGLTRIYFGADNDQPIPGDYNNDGSFEPAIYRSSSGLWAIKGVTRLYFGVDGDIPVPGFYQESECSGVAVFRPASGLWAIKGRTRLYFGAADDLPVPGDYGGAGYWSPGVYRGSAGLWALLRLTRIYFGASSDQPVPGNYTGSGEDRIGIFREGSGLWAIKNLSRVYFGGDGDSPIVR